MRRSLILFLTLLIITVSRGLLQVLLHLPTGLDTLQTLADVGSILRGRVAGAYNRYWPVLIYSISGLSSITSLPPRVIAAFIGPLSAYTTILALIALLNTKKPSTITLLGASYMAIGLVLFESTAAKETIAHPLLAGMILLLVNSEHRRHYLFLYSLTVIIALTHHILSVTWAAALVSLSIYSATFKALQPLRGERGTGISVGYTLLMVLTIILITLYSYNRADLRFKPILGLESIVEIAVFLAAFTLIPVAYWVGKPRLGVPGRASPILAAILTALAGLVSYAVSKSRGGATASLGVTGLLLPLYIYLAIRQQHHRLALISLATALPLVGFAAYGGLVGEVYGVVVATRLLSLAIPLTGIGAVLYLSGRSSIIIVSLTVTLILVPYAMLPQTPLLDSLVVGYDEIEAWHLTSDSGRPVAGGLKSEYLSYLIRPKGGWILLTKYSLSRDDVIIYLTQADRAYGIRYTGLVTILNPSKLPSPVEPDWQRLGFIGGTEIWARKN